MHAHLTAAVVSNDPHFIQARISYCPIYSIHSQIFVNVNYLLDSSTSLQLRSAQEFTTIPISIFLPQRTYSLYSFVLLTLKLYLQEVIGNTVNGTTYAGLRARTTGAPQNHWWVQSFLNFGYLHENIAKYLRIPIWFVTGLDQLEIHWVLVLAPQKQ